MEESGDFDYEGEGLKAAYEPAGATPFYIDNPHPCWFGCRSKLKTATGMSEEASMSPYTTAESRHMRTKYYSNYKLEDNEHMYRGRSQERFILERFCDRHGLLLLQVALLKHPLDARLAATPDGLGLELLQDCETFHLHDLEAKCPIQETKQPPLQYLCQMASQMEVTELKDAYLVTHSSTGHARCWQEKATPRFFEWLRRMSHRGLQYDAMGVSDQGHEWSSRGLRGFLRGPNTTDPPRDVNKPMLPEMLEDTSAALEQRMLEHQTQMTEFYENRSGRITVAPYPHTMPFDSYQEPLPKLADFYSLQKTAK